MLQAIGHFITAAGSGVGSTWHRMGSWQARPGRLAVPLRVGLLCGCCGVGALGQALDRSPETGEPAGLAGAGVLDDAGVLDATWGVGSWVWAPETHDKQTCHLWHSFEIPAGAGVAKADLRIAVDNGYRLLLDGRELGIGSDWRSITEYDVSLLLAPGWHVLAVDAFNDNREAGLLFGLNIALKDGRKIAIPSDPNWRVAPVGEPGWERRRVAPDHWVKAVVVSAFLPRTGGWFARIPTMIVKVPVLRPLQLQFWQRGWFQASLVGVAVVALLGCLRLMAQLAVQGKAQAMLQRERARIARDIHDELGARLTELALAGEVAQTELPADSDARGKFAALSEKARALSGAMDEVVWMVNSRRDTLRDFATYACQYAQRFLAPTPIRCRLDVEANLPQVMFELPVRRNLLLAVKEALNNAAKYSAATELCLHIHRRGHSVLVTVEDNGAGFDLELADPARNGLTNMAQRMRELGGECRITSAAGAGCQVEFQVPLPKASLRAEAPGEHPGLLVSHGHGVPPVSPATPGSKEISP